MCEAPWSGRGHPPGGAHRLIEQNLPLVEHITNRVAASFPRHVDREELARAGMVGLVEAASRYDASKGRFATFAGRRIEGAILDEVRSRTWAPRSVRGRSRWLEQVEDELAQAGGRRPAPSELARAAGLTPDELDRHRAREARGRVDSLDRPLGQEADATVADLVTDVTGGPADRVEEDELHRYLRAAVANLPERHRLVIVGAVVEGRPMAELAALLDVSQSRVSQLKDDALRLLRDGIEAQYRDRPGPPATGRAQQRRAAYAAAVAAHAARAWRPAPGPVRRPDPEPTPVVA